MIAPSLFFLLNGLASLLTETVWLKSQVVLFGATPGAYGSILFAYFLGTAIGAASYGRIVRLLGRRGLGIAFAASLVFSFVAAPLLAAFGHVPLSSLFGSPLYDAARWGVALVAILPACALWGAMYPLAATAVSGSSLVVLYGLSAAGAALGVCGGTFLLPYAIGYHGTAVVAFAANLLSLRFLYAVVPDVSRLPSSPKVAWAFGRPQAIAFGCGFLALLLQVLCIRFIAIGSDNSIYAFGAASLVVVALLTVSSIVASRLPAGWLSSHDFLHVVMLLSLLGVIAAVAAFAGATHDLRIAPIEVGGFSSALALALSTVGVGYLFPSFIFPPLLRCARGPAEVGSLVGYNSIGCAAGAVVTSFVLLPRVGMWPTALAAMVGYVLLTLLLERLRPRLAAGALAAMVILFVDPLDRPLSTPTDPYDPDRAPHGRVVAALEGSYGIVTVAEYPDRRMLWLNNNYQLEAGLSNVQGTQRMGILPTLLVPSAERALMIGIGTGISASGLVAAPLHRIDLVELIPEVREAASRYFGRYNLDVLSEPRVRSHVADGRQFLAMSRETYAVVISDLFTPWNEGTAYLYTRDHFRAVRDHLAPGGVFVLWLPMYQLAEAELYAIMRTYASVFANASIWQLEISTDMSVLGVVSEGPFDIDAMAEGLAHRAYGRRVADIVELHPSGIVCRYVAPISALTEMWSGAPLITADRPVLERMAAQKGRRTLTERRFLAFVEPLYRAQANPGGRIWSRWDDTLEIWRQSGLALNRYWYEDRHGDAARARAMLVEIQQKNPATQMAAPHP